MTKEEFRQLCKAAWDKQHGFVFTDLSSKKFNGKYRSGLYEFYFPNQSLKDKMFSLRFTKWRILLNKFVSSTVGGLVEESTMTASGVIELIFLFMCPHVALKSNAGCADSATRGAS